MSDVTLRSDIKVEYVQHMGNDEMVCKAARVSLDQDQGDQARVEGLINHLAKETHTMPFEHNALSIRVECPIFVHRQIMTHRVLSKSTQSGRYVQIDPEYYVPGEERPLVNVGTSARPVMEPAKNGVTHEATLISLNDSYETAASVYDYLTAGDPEHDDVIAKEIARIVEPQAQYTSTLLTGNLYAWFQFLERRDGSDGHPQWEIVELANQIWPIIEEHWPIAAKAWKERNKGKTRKLVREFIEHCHAEGVANISYDEGTLYLFDEFVEWAEERNK